MGLKELQQRENRRRNIPPTETRCFLLFCEARELITVPISLRSQEARKSGSYRRVLTGKCRLIIWPPQAPKNHGGKPEGTQFGVTLLNRCLFFYNLTPKLVTYSHICKTDIDTHLPPNKCNEMRCGANNETPYEGPYLSLLNLTQPLWG